MTKIKQYNCPECGGDELHIPIHLTIKGGKLLPIDFDYYYNNLPTDDAWRSVVRSAFQTSRRERRNYEEIFSKAMLFGLR